MLSFEKGCVPIYMAKLRRRMESTIPTAFIWSVTRAYILGIAILIRFVFRKVYRLWIFTRTCKWLFRTILLIILVGICVCVIRNMDIDTEYQPPSVVDYDHVQLKNDVVTQRIRSIIGGSMRTMRKTLNHKSVLRCPLVPEKLVGPISVNTKYEPTITWEGVNVDNKDVRPGGIWQPSTCIARHRVAIILPYRNRETQLRRLLSHLIPILKRQQLDFQIFVVEQQGDGTFNKGLIMNAAFKEAIKIQDFQCFVFHDVDLLLENDRNMYSCPEDPRHLSVAVDKLNYRLPYDFLAGGVLNMRTEHFLKVNGYSNLYWGWGAEDDDIGLRIRQVGLKISRLPSMIARYKMIKHQAEESDDVHEHCKRVRLLQTGTRRFKFDGVNSAEYKVISIKKEPLFTHVLVDLGKTPFFFSTIHLLYLKYICIVAQIQYYVG